jgi:hypothetical protein
MRAVKRRGGGNHGDGVARLRTHTHTHTHTCRRRRCDAQINSRQLVVWRSQTKGEKKRRVTGGGKRGRRGRRYARCEWSFFRNNDDFAMVGVAYLESLLFPPPPPSLPSSFVGCWWWCFGPLNTFNGNDKNFFTGDFTFTCKTCWRTGTLPPSLPPTLPLSAFSFLPHKQAKKKKAMGCAAHWPGHTAFTNTQREGERYTSATHIVKRKKSRNGERFFLFGVCPIT